MDIHPEKFANGDFDWVPLSVAQQQMAGKRCKAAQVIRISQWYCSGILCPTDCPRKRNLRVLSINSSTYYISKLALKENCKAKTIF